MFLLKSTPSQHMNVVLGDVHERYTRLEWHPRGVRPPNAVVRPPSVAGASSAEHSNRRERSRDRGRALGSGSSELAPGERRTAGGGQREGSAEVSLGEDTSAGDKMGAVSTKNRRRRKNRSHGRVRIEVAYERHVNQLFIRGDGIVMVCAVPRLS